MGRARSDAVATDSAHPRTSWAWTRAGALTTRSAPHTVRYRGGMPLPFGPPIAPMLARLAAAIPEEGDWLFEPKWDGFRAIVFRDGNTLHLQSRDLRPLERYFPELIEPLQRQLPERCVLDGEIVIAGPVGLDFDALLLRIHPAASRVAMLAKASPASYVAWDILAVGAQDLRSHALAERRERLERILRDAAAPLHVTPATRERARALDWFDRFEGAGLDGVVAKRLDSLYLPGKRAMLKIKHERTADCVVAGFRWHARGPGTHVGSLILGLYDEGGGLHQAGITSSFGWARRAELALELEPLRAGTLEGHPWVGWSSGRDEGATPRRPDMTSRWDRGRDLSWEPLRPERVCEVSYDHLQGDRFRHAATFRRWRPDRSPQDCRYDQLAVASPYDLSRVLRGS